MRRIVVIDGGLEICGVRFGFVATSGSNQETAQRSAGSVVNPRKKHRKPSVSLDANFRLCAFRLLLLVV
jgi:hypothetical protein